LKEVFPGICWLQRKIMKYVKENTDSVKEVTYEMLHARFQIHLQILQLCSANTNANNTKHSIHCFLIYSCISTLSLFIWLVLLAAPSHLCRLWCFEGQVCKAMGYIDTWIWGPTAPMHIKLKEQALCAPLLVSSIISGGASRQMTGETSISEKWNYG
jgi:hypothetical protein